MNKPWYSAGLAFSCVRCSACCRGESGYVFITRAEALKIAGQCALSAEEFYAVYCRQVDLGAEKRFSLKEKSNGDCVFWNGGCGIYENRPAQCRTYPFWASMLESSEIWEKTSVACPGTRQKTIRDCAFIEDCLQNC
ncbi:MAG: YkgJ family cysteine cluster protein [Spirochaetaceae bacterium]|nr:YkgJ family cysteine cluster protein [Spirochaetaceae bacterium]